ncbi:GAF domain-containing sensor histidine kinase [Evansella clarkii]|uniref:GAF domain-containing sensor histidine kinase n=1 Tax=Evansella clarkii TaxID=79879 RepID=UPI001475D632|nr:histidine kinase [Evansella clarkii]
MSSELRENELTTLKVIAETLNRSNDLHAMLSVVLDRLLEITGLSAGWIFLSESKGEYVCSADSGLPPALEIEEKKPMREGVCWCIEKFWSGRLTSAVNIMECKRLEDSISLKRGDTKGITHHATVPLKAGEETFGLLNVAAPGKIKFTEEELALLSSVAFQIGTAIKRMKLYEAQQHRAEEFVRLDVASRELKKLNDIDTFPEQAAHKIKAIFGFTFAALYIKTNTAESLSVIPEAGEEFTREILTEAEKKRDVVFTEEADQKVAAIPLLSGEDTAGFLLAGRDRSCKIPGEIFSALAGHLTLAMENAKLHKMRQEISVMEERNRLARDLHDSVTQTLFSLSLTAKGAKNIYKHEAEIKETFEDLQQMAQTALAEMRSLIWQLKPPGLEDGVIAALKKYGSNLGMQVHAHVEGVAPIPEKVEETLWRIGQEALNNACKHGDTSNVFADLKLTKENVRLIVKDNGRGFNPEKKFRSAGLTGMIERAEELHGTVKINSGPGIGTEVIAEFPVKGGV